MSGKIMQDLALKLSADTAELKRGMREANQSLNSLNKNTSLVTSGLKGLAAGMAAAFSAKVIIDGIKNTIVGIQQMADRLLDLEQITGANTDTLQEWQYVAKMAGVNTETFSNAVEGLTQRMARGTGGGKDFNEALKALNISIKDAEGNLRNGADVTEEAIKKLADMDNVTQRNVLGAKLFTGAWKDLSPIMGFGAEGIDELREEAHSLGLVLDNEALIAANDFRMTMVELNESLTAIKNNIALNLIPFLSNLALGFRSTIDVIKKAIRDGIQNSISSDMEEINDLAERYLNKGLVSTLAEGRKKATDDLLKSLEKQRDYWKGYYGDISQLADREERVFARNRLKDLNTRINSLKSSSATSTVGGTGGTIGIINELNAKIKEYSDNINSALTPEQIAYWTQQKVEAEAYKNELIETAKAAANLAMYMDLLGGRENTIPTRANGLSPKPLEVESVPIPILDPKEITVFKEFSDYLNEATNNVWNLIDAASLIGDAFGKSFTDAQGALKGLVSGMLDLAKSIMMVAIAEQIKAAQGSVQNFLTGGGWGIIAATAGVAALSSLWNSVQLASGGLAYGETLATVGEYAGAKSNPEVIAPLSDLKGILADSMGGVSGEVRFEIEGDKLVGILSKYNNKKIYF